MIGPGNNNIGERIDYVDVPYVPGSETALAYLQTGYYHIHGTSFIHPDKANPVQLTSAVASWADTGNKIEIIPANTITKAFDLHWCSISEISADLYGIIDLFKGAAGKEIKIGLVDVNRTINFSREGVAPIQIPQQEASTRISARFTDSTTSSRTVRIKLYGHIYGASL